MTVCEAVRDGSNPFIHPCDCSSIGRASDCESDRCEFKSRQSPFKK